MHVSLCILWGICLIICHVSYLRWEETDLNKKIFQITLILITIGLIIPNSIGQAFAQDTTNTSTLASGTWSLQIEVSPNNTVTFSLNDLYTMPKTTVYADLSCYGLLLKSGLWGGVSLKTLLAQAGFTGQSANLQLYATDGYNVPFGFSESTSDYVIVAYEVDGNPLDETLRLVVPEANGENWIALICKI